MQIQYVSRYIALSEEGLAFKMDCPIDQGSLLCNLDENDKIYLYCLSCNYKNFIGLDLYNSMVRTVKRLEKM